jgi:hypothetical protein
MVEVSDTAKNNLAILHCSIFDLSLSRLPAHYLFSLIFIYSGSLSFFFSGTSDSLFALNFGSFGTEDLNSEVMRNAASGKGKNA